MIDWESIRANHPILSFLQNRGIRLRQSQKAFVGKCPIHAERNGEAFVVWPEEGRWKCFGKCNAGGDVIDLCAKLEGITTSEAAARLANKTPLYRPSKVQTPSAPVAQTPPYQLTEADRDRMARAAHRLATDHELIEKLCKARPEWDADTVRGIALDGDLGWENGAIFFGYRHGIKSRWKDSEGKRRVVWICGSAYSECWRQSLMLRSHKKVYFNEGETDVITLVSAGFEKLGCIVLGLSSSTGYPQTDPFRQKQIVIVPDYDLAGERCAKELMSRLGGVAASVALLQYSRKA
jgi:DNA primase